MDTWLPQRINETTSKFYEAIGLLGCTYVDIEATMQETALALLCDHEKEKCKLKPFIVRLGSDGIDKAIRECVAERYKKEDDIKETFNFVCELANSARIARNAYLHSTFGVNVISSNVEFKSNPDRKASRGRNFKTDLEGLRLTCKEVLKARNYCFAAALWALHPEDKQIKVIMNGEERILEFSSFDRPSLVETPKWVHNRL